MSIDRRTFLKLTSAAGLSLIGLPAPRAARADAHLFDGPYWVTIHAGGGWDPTLLCDPKGRDGEDDPEPINTYDRGAIEEVGPFRIAPVEGNRAFFEKYRDRLLVINGIDTGTNSHATGTQTVWSGDDEASFPALAALLAARERGLPLAWLTYGGYSEADGLVPATRIPNVSSIGEVAFPQRLNPAEVDSTLFPPASLDAIREARAARLERAADHASLPRMQRAMNMLFEARTGDNELRRLTDFLPSDLSSGNPLFAQAEVACACLAAGLTVSANLVVGGFDTHGNHDASHTPRIQALLEGVDYLMQQAEEQGIADKLIVVVGSEFGRTPGYNDGGGKDHWTITSMMMMGPGIRGGRVVGATDERQAPRLVDPGTLAVSDGGTRIRPGHIHAALRSLAGIESDPITAPYGLDDERLPLLG